MTRLATLIACFVLPAVAWSAVPSEIDEQIIGGWQLKMTTPDGEDREPIVLIGRHYDRYAAWYVGQQGMEPMKDVQLKDDVLIGKITPKEQPDVSVTLEARLTDKDTCQGVGKYRSADGDAGSWDFAGKKLSLSSAGEVYYYHLLRVELAFLAEQPCQCMGAFQCGENPFAFT